MTEKNIPPKPLFPIDVIEYELLDFYNLSPGTHHEEPATTPYSCHGVFTVQSI